MESDRLDQVLIVLLVCLSQGDGGMANMICNFSLDVNEDGKVTLHKTRLIHHPQRSCSNRLFPTHRNT
jgi:hypothetical protein